MAMIYFGMDFKSKDGKTYCTVCTTIYGGED
jgi:uncharacterized Zn finger protein (UPF0148 family)